MSTPRRRRPRQCRAQAFTLIELLVVVGIIAILISILMPALRKAHETANGVKCMSNQRQIMQAFLIFAVDHGGRLPGNFTDFGNPDTDKRAWLLNAQEPLTNAPMNGTLWKYLKNKDVYMCPSLQADNVRGGSNSNGQFDYASFAVFTGARVTNIKNQSKHRLPGNQIEYLPTPIVCDEGASSLNRDNIEGFHNGSDPIANTHPNSRWRIVNGVRVEPLGGGYYASIDGSVHWFKEPRNSAGAGDWSQRGPRGREVSFGETGYHIIWGWWDAQ